jgi:predicted Zn-dependent protease
VKLSEFAIGEELYREIQESVIIDTSGWTVERVRRVAARLQAGDLAAERLSPKVIWIEEPTAFTAPGRYVYFSRELLQRLTEEATALVFAHELAHHRLGHVSRGGPRLPLLRELPGAAVLALLRRAGSRLLFSPENELAADRWGLARCRAAGYDPRRCLELFKVLERRALDLGADPSVFGPESAEEMAEREAPAAPKTAWARLLRLGERTGRWVWERKYGYKTLRERHDALQATL